MEIVVVTVSLVLVIGVVVADAAGDALQPGCYEIQIETGMPNVDKKQWGRTIVTKCLTRADVYCSAQKSWCGGWRTAPGCIGQAGSPRLEMRA